MAPNEIVHKAMGLCWHDKLDIEQMRFGGVTPPHKCCGRSKFFAHDVPDYSQPENIGKVYAWLRGPHISTANESVSRLTACVSYLEKETYWNLHGLMLLKPSEQIRLIAEWVTEGFK